MPNNKIVRNKMELLGKLTASLTHELRNPLSAIKMNLEYLKMLEDELPAHINETVDSTAEALNRIQYLIENILDFSRSNGKGNSSCNINRVTSKAVEIINISVTSNFVLINLDLDEKLPLVKCDENKLLQVILNLLTNAIEACSKEGTISIETRRNDSNIFWSISDTGVGIRKEDIERIFDDFYTNKEKGTGLGLSVCKRLINEMGAKLLIESEPGVGSTFSITFSSDQIING